MRRLMRGAARLYPAAWRARYGEELDALLEDTGARWPDVLDILKGAILMQMSGTGFWKIAAGFTLAGALISGAWSLTVPDRYVSSAVLRIGEPSRLRTLQQTVFARQSLANIIVQQKLYERERAKDPLEDIVLQMRTRDLRLVQTGNSEFTVSFTSDSPAEARATVGAVVAALNEANVKAAAAQGGVNLEVVEAASLPASPVGPDRGRMIRNGVAAGMALGILCGALWSVVRRGKRWSWNRIGIFAAAGMVTGIAIAVLLPDEYVSTAVLRAADGGQVQAALEGALSDASLGDVILRNQLYQRDRRQGAMAPAIGKMRNTAIRVQEVMLANGHARAYTLSFRYTDRFKARAATQDLVSRIVSGMPAGAAAEVLDPPSMPEAPSSPNRAQIAVFGVIAGGLVGMAASRRRWVGMVGVGTV